MPIVSATQHAPFLPVAVAPGGVSALSDWIARSTGAGVTYACDFSGPNDFVLASTNGGHVFAGGMSAPVLARVVKDTTDGLTNGCCLRIDTPAAVGTNSAAWIFSFNPAWTLNNQDFGSAEWYIFFRFKIPASRLVLSNCGGAQRAWKWLNIAQYSPEDTDSQSFSNTLAEHVLQDSEQSGFPRAYHRDIGGNFPPFEIQVGPSDFAKQTAIDKGSGFSGGDRYCLANGTPACVYFPVDEWMSFKVRLKLVYNGTTGNEFDVWYAGYNATSWTQLFNDRDYSVGDPNSSGGGFTGLTGGHFLTFESNRIDSTVDTHQKWDQLIVSTQDIALPAVISTTALGALANSMAPGTWAELTTINLEPTINQDANPGNIFAYANNGVWDPVHGIASYVGQDHGPAYPSLVKYVESTNRWDIVDATIPGLQGHGYNHLTVNPAGPNAGDLYFKNYGANNTWLAKKPYGGAWDTTFQATFSGSNITFGTAWWSGALTGVTGSQGAVIIYEADFGMWGSYDVEDDIWTEYSDSSWQSDSAGYHQNAAYSAVKNHAVFAPGNSGDVKMFRINANATVTRLTDIPAGCAVGSQRGNICCDPVSGNFMILTQGDLWEFNASGSGTYTKQTGSRVPPAGVNAGLPDFVNYCSIWIEIPTYGVMMVVSGHISTIAVHLYKHA